MSRSILKYISETIPFLVAPIVGSSKDFPVAPKEIPKDNSKLLAVGELDNFKKLMAKANTPRSMR
jgi:hypothetical protein